MYQLLNKKGIIDFYLNQYLKQFGYHSLNIKLDMIEGNETNLIYVMEYDQQLDYL